jgi:RpiB/LacA/LacB family sugar-phosphate isomerase
MATIFLGADHGGFALKEKVKAHLQTSGHNVEDLGAHELTPDDDYPDYAYPVAQKVGKGEGIGILFCRSGHGVDIVANRVKGVRAALCPNPEYARRARNDDDCNILVLAADLTDEKTAFETVDKFLTTPFAGDPRFARRIGKIKAIEEGKWPKSSPPS